MNSGQWVIKIQSDQVKGPYSTDAVIKMILNGAFAGTEEICAYPEGEWQVLTKQPEFYDALLESLENPVEVDNKKAQKMEAETVIRPSEPAGMGDVPVPGIQSHDDLKEFIENERKAEEARQKEPKKELVKVPQVPAVSTNLNASLPKVPDILSERDKNLEIQMSDLQQLKKKEARRIIPFILLILALAGVVTIVFSPEKEDLRSGWSLTSPKKSSTEISAADLLRLKRQAIKGFQSGLMEQVLEAQKALVQAVEGSPRDLEAMGLLCMAYEQIWPYSKQTQEDLKSIDLVKQMARSVNPISNYSESCQTISLIANGHPREARSLLEKTLDNQTEEKFSLGAFLYLIKGEILEGESNFINAAAYYEQATKYWPQWQTAHFGLARMYYKQGKLSEARDEYSLIYKENKESKAALFGLALVEIKSQKNYDKALTYFTNGFGLKQQLPKDFITEALLNYAQILVEKNDKKKALEVAQEGYKISPSHRMLKDIVISLGGDSKVENAESEIMIIAQQFEQKGDFMVAQAQYKAAYEIDPNNAEAAFRAGRCLWKINQTRDAILWLEKSIKADPKMIQAYVLKADYESQKYNFSAATRTLQAASKKFAQSHEIAKAQALLEFRKNNMTMAIQYGERAAKIYNADVELLSLLAQAYISIYMNAPANSRKDLEMKNNAKEQARRYAGRAIDLESAWPEAQITYAKLLEAVDGPVRGETYLKELIKAFPYTIEYRIALAEFYKNNEKFEDAARVYEEVVSIDPKNKKAHFGLGEAYRILNRPDMAEKYYNLTSALDPTDVEPMFANAKLKIETASGNNVSGNMESALAKLELVRKINPDFPKVAFLQARCYLEQNDYAKALEKVNEEKKMNPNIADSYILAAEIYYRKGQYKDCAIEYSTALKMRPAAELYVKASVCYRYSDAIDIAEDMLATAIQKESGYAEIYREQGYILEKKGRRQEAVQSFEKYLVLSPNAIDKQIIEAKIQELGG